MNLKIVRTIIFLFLTLTILPVASINVLAGSETVFIIDNEEYSVQTDFDTDNSIAIKLVDFVTALDYDIKWNEEKRSVEINNDSNNFIILIDQNKCIKNGSLMYVSKPAYIEQDISYLPLSFINDIFNFNVFMINATDDEIKSIILKSDTPDFFEIQKSVTDGKDLWRLNPIEVAEHFVGNVLNYQGGKYDDTSNAHSEYARVNYTKDDGTVISIDLYQPANKGESGIWEVESWYDTDNKRYHVRDLSKLLPLFYNEDKIPDDYKDIFRNKVCSIFIEAYKPHYDILGFESSGVEFNKTNSGIELYFRLNMINRYYHKDPDTVEYIKKAKENMSSEYLTLYYEYNMTRESNYLIKLTAGLLPNGQIDAESIELFGGYDTFTGTPNYVSINEFFPDK